MAKRDEPIWVRGRAPCGFWNDEENHRAYFDWVREKLGIQKPEDWYQFETTDLRRFANVAILKRYTSVVTLVKKFIPHYDWKEWLFSTTPYGFWEDPDNQRRYLDWIGEKLGYEKVEDWYQLDSKTLIKNRGTGILTTHNNSHIDALKSYMPDYPWKEWLFSQVQAGFWDDPSNRRRYFDWLGERLGFDKPEDWYQLKAHHLEANRGSNLLHQFDSSPFGVLKAQFPDYDWKEWLFDHIPLRFWDDPDNVLTYLDWLAKKLGFLEPEDWYQLTSISFKKHRGAGLLLKFGGSPVAVTKFYLQFYLPDYPLKEWMFQVGPTGFWHQRENRLRYLDWLGKELGFEQPEDWYQVTSFDFTENYGGTILRLHRGPSMIVMENFPEYEWREWLFRVIPKGFFAKAANRHRYLDWLGEMLGYEEPEDWYQLTKKTVQDFHGLALLRFFNESPSTILKDYRPDYDWKEWLFIRPPRGLWEDRRNYRRYLEWLGEKLGLEGPEEWLKIRTLDLRENCGSSLIQRFGSAKGLVEYCLGNVAPVKKRRRKPRQRRSGSSR